MHISTRVCEDEFASINWKKEKKKKINEIGYPNDQCGSLVLSHKIVTM